MRPKKVDGMDSRTAELVGITLSVAGRCHPCFPQHLAKAIELGIGEEDTRDALDLAERIGKAGGQRMDELAEDQLKESTKEGKK